MTSTRGGDSLEPTAPESGLQDIITLRNFQAGDEDKLLELQAIALRSSGKFYTSKQIASLVESQARGRHWKGESFIIALYQQQIVGFSAGIISHGIVTGVYVHPDYERQGIGSRLLKNLEAQAIAYGKTKMKVVSSLNAEAFYRTNQYKFVKRTGFYASFHVWIPCTRFQKELQTKHPSLPISNTSQLKSYMGYGAIAVVIALFSPYLNPWLEKLISALT